MKNAFKLFAKDIKKIGKAPTVLIILIGLAILPSFYAWFNLEASWDPYGNTKNIKIAVVNEDEGDTIKGEKLNVGDKIEEKLKKDKHFNWQFVSREKADRDIKMGKLYAGIYVPKEFTHELTGTLRKAPQRAHVTYKVNQKLNAIAPKMTDAGTSAIVQKANDKFDQTVTKALLEIANDLGIQLEDEIPTINKIKNGVYKANEAMPKINELSKKILYLDENQDKIDQYADQFRNAGQYKDEVMRAVRGLNRLNESMPAIRERAQLVVGLNEFMPRIERALNKASQVPQAFPEINNGVHLALDGTEKGLNMLNDVQGRIPDLHKKLDHYNKLLDDAKRANKDAEKRAQDALKKAQQKDKSKQQDNDKQQNPDKQQNDQQTQDDQASDQQQHTSPNDAPSDTQNHAQDQRKQQQAQQNEERDDATAQPHTAQQSASNHHYVTRKVSEQDSNKEKEQSEHASQDKDDQSNTPQGNGVSKADRKAMSELTGQTFDTLLNQIRKQNNATITDTEQLQRMIEQLLASDKPQQFSDPLAHFNERLSQAQKFNQHMIDVLSAVSEAENVDMSNIIKQFESTNDELNKSISKVQALQKAISSGHAGKVEAIALLKQLDQTYETVKQFKGVINNDLSHIISDISTRIQNTLNKGTTAIATLQSKLDMVDQIAKSGTEILNQAHQRLQQLNNALPRIEQAYVNAVQTAQKYFPTLKRDIQSASNFVQNDLPTLEQRLANATQTVNTKIPELFNKYDKLVSLLDENQPEAKRHLHNLANFIRNDLPGVEQDVQKATNIFKQLDKDDSIDNLVNILKNDLKKHADVIANPIDIDEQDVFPVKDYGSASTPFYTALAIWVGALLMISLLSVHNKHADLKPYLTTREVFLGKSGLFFMMGIIQSLIVSIGNLVFLNASMEAPVLFVLIAILTSLVFVSIVYSLVSILGNPGKALAIVILVLQIAGGGGTFPIEVTPEFFQNIHPFLPFSYAIDAMREAVGGPVPQILITKLTILSLFGIGFFVLGLIFKPILHPFITKITERASKSDILE